MSEENKFTEEERQAWLNSTPSEGKAKLCKTKINAAQRRVLVMELRLQGKSFRHIAEELGTSLSNVYRDYRTVMKEFSEQALETASEIRSLECQRLDELQNEMWSQLAEARSEKMDEDGDSMPRSAQDQNASLGTVNAIIRIMERRSKLAGLDAPSKHTIDVRKVDDIAQTIAKVALRYIPVESRAAFAGEITSIIENAVGVSSSATQMEIGKRLTGSPLNSAAMQLPHGSQPN
tara:strand:+ start:400 stop:1101 length:702 start_codon:yes stop_codon:yes gene_type:complete